MCTDYMLVIMNNTYVCMYEGARFILNIHKGGIRAPPSFCRQWGVFAPWTIWRAYHGLGLVVARISFFSLSKPCEASAGVNTPKPSIQYTHTSISQPIQQSIISFIQGGEGEKVLPPPPLENLENLSRSSSRRSLLTLGITQSTKSVQLRLQNHQKGVTPTGQWANDPIFAGKCVSRLKNASLGNKSASRPLLRDRRPVQCERREFPAVSRLNPLRPSGWGHICTYCNHSQQTGQLIRETLEMRVCAKVLPIAPGLSPTVISSEKYQVFSSNTSC